MVDLNKNFNFEFDADLTKDEIDIIEEYCANIIENGFIPILDVYHLSSLSKFKVHFIVGMAKNSSRSYRNFEVAKADGSSRLISAPLPDLKELQSWLKINIFDRAVVSKYCHSYRSGRSIKTNASLHIGQKIVVKYDLIDFFGSIKKYHIYHMLLSFGYTKELSGLISSIVCLNGSLPQGSPASPSVSNFMLKDIDDALGSYCLSNKYRYTRYADDITVSGDIDVKSLNEYISNLFRGTPYKINHEKTRILRTGARQIVCGVVVNNKMSPVRQDLRSFLQECYYIGKYGISEHIRARNINEANYLESLIGKGQH